METEEKTDLESLEWQKYINMKGRKPENGFIPLPGFSWNPLVGYPPNLLCFCESGKKFKKCHRGKIPEVIKTEKVESVKRGIQKCISVLGVRSEANKKAKWG